MFLLIATIMYGISTGLKYEELLHCATDYVNAYDELPRSGDKLSGIAKEDLLSKLCTLRRWGMRLLLFPQLDNECEV